VSTKIATTWYGWKHAARWLPLMTLLLAPDGRALAGDPPPPPPSNNRQTHIVEWNLPAVADASPGAIIVDTKGDDKNRVYFVTRLGQQRVVRLNPHKSLMKGAAQWTSWELSADSFNTGGTKKIKASHDRRYIYVRAATSIQRIDTGNCDTATPQTCNRTEWLDQPGSFNVSDLTIDDYNNVYTVSASGDAFAPTLEDSYLQKLIPGTIPANNATGSSTVKRWKVGGGAGFCSDLGRTTLSFPCLSGIAVHPSNNNLIYYSEPEGGPDGQGAIGELNVQSNTVRRWAFTTLPPDTDAGAVQQPRQLHIDRFGKVWVITGSGHLVSLDPCTNKMTKHALVNGMLSDPFGLAPDDDVVGYTDAGVSNSRVGMLIPLGTSITVPPTSASLPPTTDSVTSMGERANVDSGSVQPQGAVVATTVTTKADGIFVDAYIGAQGVDGNTPSHDSESPLGITANRGKGQGTFFYAVGIPGDGTVNRIGFVRLPMPKKPKHPRDDDDTEDGQDHDNGNHGGKGAGWHTHKAEDGDGNGHDDDDDGVDADNDNATAREDVDVADPAPVAAGQYTDYYMTASSTSLALIATSTAEDALSLLRIDIYNPAGVLVTSSPTTPGVAAATVLLPAPGQYKARVRNLGFTSLTQTPTLIVREPWN